MFETLLSRIGIGAATVDTVLTQSEVVRGEMMNGEIRLVGGKAPQVIHRIELELMTRYRQDLHEGSTAYDLSIKHFSLAGEFTLSAGEHKVIPFETLVPIQTPISLGPTSVWLNTDLDVPWAVDPKDVDPLTILPEPASQKLLGAFAGLGYEHTASSGTYLTMTSDADLPFMQAFSLVRTVAMADLPETLQVLVQANGYDAEIQIVLPQAERVQFRLRHEAAFGIEDLRQKLRS